MGRGINSFAAAIRATTSSIGVTRVCVKLLTPTNCKHRRHEFSHILNGARH